MKTIYIPDLYMGTALRFCKEIDNQTWDTDVMFDYSNVKNCDPFPMLLVAKKVNEIRSKYQGINYCDVNVKNSYASIMRFYRFIGLNEGRPMEGTYGNENYQPITEIKMQDLYNGRRETGREIGELITEESSKIASVLSRGDGYMKQTMTYCLREMIRNIQEHSWASSGWYCAQYWPSHDLIEVAIMDSGRGILDSINSNQVYAYERMNNKEAIIKAMEPGISRTFDENYNEEIFATRGNEWKNSGFGLYMVSRICAKTGGDFLLASGDNAVKINSCNDARGNYSYTSYDTSFQGTIIRMRLRASGIKHIQKIIADINDEAKHLNVNGFKTASKSSSFHMGDFDNIF